MKPTLPSGRRQEVVFAALGIVAVATGAGSAFAGGPASTTRLLVSAAGTIVIVTCLAGAYAWLAAAGRRQLDSLRHEVRAREEAEAEHRLLVEANALQTAERQKVRSLSLEGLGHLSGGVAHDFNNLLGVILNFTAFVQTEVAAASRREGEERWRQVQHDLARVQEAAERGAQLTQKLQAFARSEAVQIEKEISGEVPTPQATPGSGETILVVEDEPALREVMVRMLGRNGYQVFTADGGAEALQFLKDFEGEIHLLITDVVMPLMHGREFAEKASALRRDAGLLYISGYPQPVLDSQGRIAPGSKFIEKPFTEAALLARVREAVEATAAIARRNGR